MKVNINIHVAFDMAFASKLAVICSMSEETRMLLGLRIVVVWEVTALV
jgi:hypothetical protein